MTDTEQTLNDCEAFVSQNALATGPGEIAPAQYRKDRRNICAAALDACREDTPRHKMAKQTRAIARERYGFSWLQSITLLFSIIRFSQMIYFWYRDRNKASNE